MNIQSLKKISAVILLAGALAACAPIQPESAPADSGTGATTTSSTPDGATEMPEEATEEQPTTAPDRAAVAPLDAAECEAIQMAVAEQLGVDFTVEEADFANEISGLHGTACTVTATGTGEDFGNFVDVAQSIRDILTAEGWTENSSYLADGPTGTATGYELDNKLALVSVDWQPAEGVECPDDQPISACEVEPSEQDFTVVIELVQLG
jgi:hypothetical protein